MIEIKAPNEWHYYKTKFYIFLAGSIEMGAAELWQDKFTKIFSKYYNVVILNPRRDDWDSTWEQSISNSKFNEQVSWELNALEKADIIPIYFQPGTKSPISLMELGLFKDKCIVCCPNGFWRKGNIDIVCKRYNIPLFETLGDMGDCIILKYFINEIIE